MPGCTGSIFVGSAPVITATFAEDDGVPADPTAVEVVTYAPDGTRTVYTHPDATISNPSTGTWVFTFPAGITQHGIWWVKIAGTAGILAASEVSFKVRPLHTAAPV